MKKKQFFNIGAGWHDKAAILNSLTRDIAFIDDACSVHVTSGSWPVAYATMRLSTVNWKGALVIVAIGNHAFQERLVKQVVQLCTALTTVIHPKGAGKRQRIANAEHGLSGGVR